MRERALLARLILIGGAGAGITEFIAQWPFPVIVITLVATVVLALYQFGRR